MINKSVYKLIQGSGERRNRHQQRGRQNEVPVAQGHGFGESGVQRVLHAEVEGSQPGHRLVCITAASRSLILISRSNFMSRVVFFYLHPIFS